jgi:hypothetical protein
MDVLLSGNSELISLYPKGCLSPVKPKLILPEVADSKYWRGGALKWNDPEGQYLLQTSEAAYGWTVINTDQIKPGELTSAKDLLRPEYRAFAEEFYGKRRSADGYFFRERSRLPVAAHQLAAGSSRSGFGEQVVFCFGHKSDAASHAPRKSMISLLTCWG